MKSKIGLLSVIDTKKSRAYLFGAVLDIEYKVNV